MIHVHQSPTQKERRANAFSKERALSFLFLFLQSLKGERVGIFHHTDPDGISSGIILGELVKQYTKENPVLYPTTYMALQEGTPLHQIQKNNITKALFIDLGIDGQQEFVQQISQKVSWFLIDHHELYHDADNILKPQKYTEISPSRYPCGKMAYDLASSILDVSSKDWIACLGIIGDMATEQWKEFIHETFKKYGWKEKKNYYDTVPGNVCRLITSVEATGDEKKLLHAIKILRTAKRPEDILNSSLKKIHKKVEKEINETVQKIEKKYKHEKYIYAEIKTKYYIKSPISTILGVHNPHKTVITISKEKDQYHISGRRSDGKYPVSTLIRNALAGIPGAQGGGHIQAGGGSVPEKYYSGFKKKIIEEMEKQD